MVSLYSFRPDLVIKTFEGRPIAVVEVQSRTNFTPDVATEIRRNMLARGLPSHIPYFMLLSQDRGYLWTDMKQEDPDAPPMYEFPMDSVVARYSLREPEQRLFERELELVILEWLTQLNLGPQMSNEEPEKTLERVGFNDAVKNALTFIEDEL